MDLLPRRRLRGIRQIGEGPWHAGPRGVRGHRGVAESTARRHDAAADQGRGPLQALAGHRRCAGRVAASGIAARCGSRASRPWPSPALFTNQVAKRVWKRPRPNRLSVPLARQSRRIAHVEFAAVRPLRERGGVRRRGRSGKPAARAGAGAACRTCRAVPGRDRGALSGRCVRGVRYRRGDRGAGWADRAAHRADEDSDRGPASDRHAPHARTERASCW